MEQKNETNPFGIQSEPQSSENNSLENKSDQVEQVAQSVEDQQQEAESAIGESEKREEVDVFEILSLSWKKFKENYKLLLAITLFYIAVRIMEGMTQKSLEENSLGILLAAIASGVLNVLITIGMVQILLKISRGVQANFGEIIGGGKYFWRFIGASILYGFIVIAGYILLIIPGIIWQYKYSMFSYLVIDKDMGPIEALKESGKLMYGNKWRLFFLQLLMIPVVIAGFLFFGVGIFVAIPVITLMSVFFYRTVVGEKVTI
ncbi:MAG: hypothetical protein ACD_5C00226G0007 [uncultured bacterium]|nr:MAG: hypothetical protein ACD_5C00226G0007 [uncultured bacterium]